MEHLTEKQLKAKAKADAMGMPFLAPSQYKAVMRAKAKPKYSKGAVRSNPQQIASYTARKAYKRDFKEISPDTDLIIDQTLNPEDVNESMRWPNTYGLSATYKCKTVLNARFASDNRCCVIVNPDVRDAIYTTFGDTANLNITPWPYVPGAAEPNPFSTQSIVLLGGVDDIINWCEPIILQNKQAVLPFPNTQTGMLLYPMEPEFTDNNGGTGNVAMRFMFPNAFADQARVRISLFGSSGFNLISTSTVNIAVLSNPEGVGAEIVIANNALGNNVFYIGIQILGAALPYVGDVYAFMRLNQGTSTDSDGTLGVPNHAQHVAIYDIKDADTIVNSATQAFVLAQSLLITAEMSDLNNGGVLAIARIPADSVVGGGSGDTAQFDTWYDWIASLPYNSYDGAVKHGGYSWYLPDDETGFFYRPLDTYFSKKLPYIVSEFTASDVTEAAIVRIKVATIVQFTTTSSIYDCRPSCHISEAEFMHHILSLVPASYSNEGHREGLKKALKKVGGSVVKLLKNPKTYATVASLLATLA